MNLQRIQLSHVVASSQPRPLITAEVDKMASSIKEVGLIHPITVMKTTVIHGVAEPGWKIVAGHHRVAACRALGWTEIDALVIDKQEHLQTELIEIDENLCRAELTTSQRTKYTKRRKQIWEALHPEDANTQRVALLNSDSEIQVESVVPPEFKDTGYKQPPPQTKGFAASTAEATGMTKQAINRQLARAEALGDEVLDKVINTSLDSGVELDALAKMDAPERAVLVERAAAGEKVSARTAKPVQTVSHTTESVTNPGLLQLVGDTKQALRSVLDKHGCISIAELQKMVNRKVKTASENEVDAVCDIIEYLEQWAGALSGIDVVAFANRVQMS